MPDTRPTILLSPSGRRVELWRLFEEASVELGLGWKVMGTDIEPASATALAAGEVLVVPPASSADFLPYIRDVVATHDVRLIVPTIDPELPLYAGADVGCRIAVSSAECVAIAADKLRTAEWARAAGIPAPQTRRLEELMSDSAANPASDRVASAFGGGGLLAVKPRFGSSSEGVRLRVTSAEVVSLSAQNHGREMIVQEFARGPEYTVNCFVTRDGRCVAAIPHRRLRVRSGEVSRGITVRHDAIERASVTLMEALPGAYGALCCQFIDDEDRGPLLIEINARFGGGYPLAHRAGARFPHRLLRDAAGLHDPHDQEQDEWEPGWEMFRYDQSAFHRVS